MLNKLEKVLKYAVFSDIPFKPPGPKMTQSVSYSNTTHGFTNVIIEFAPIEARNGEVVLKCWNLKEQWDFL